ncbi:MAG: hypothetical protein [Bacteriophage sp.]|nr:MAG: hypothetical protein [Bacteriophage sp.]
MFCKHAIKELKLAGYGNGEGGPNDWMYQQVIEASDYTHLFGYLNPYYRSAYNIPKRRK